MSVPWQLYVFCAVQICGAFGMFGFFWDPCLLLTGKACKAGAETYGARAMAIGFLYVGVFFLILTWLNKENVPKLKRLANAATQCVVAVLVGVMFTASKSMGGFERSIFHFGDMITMLVLLGIMFSAIAGDPPMETHRNHLREGLGINPMAFVLLVLLATLVKLVVLSDFIGPSYVLADPDSTTHLSRILWTWLNVCVFEIVLVLLYTLYIGNAKDQESITIATVFMMVVSIVSIIPMLDTFKEGLMRRGYISLTVVAVLAIVAVVGGRKNPRQDYEAVSNVV